MQRALITGAEGGLGQALAGAMGNAGMEALAPGRKELDVRDVDSVKNYFGEAGNIDLLVCNAGGIVDVPLSRMSESEWDQVMEVNLRGAFLCAREMSRSMMKRRSGHIVFISSFSALHPPVGQANYAAAKSALLGVMRSMAREIGPRNVRVNAVLPGFLETKMTVGLSENAKNSILDKHTLGSFNKPEIVGEFVTFLHKNMPHTSGQVFNLDSRVL